MTHTIEKEWNPVQFSNILYSRNTKGKELPDKGMLPLGVPEVEIYLVDQTHRGKAAFRHLYKHAKLQKRTINTQSFTGSNCECIQPKFGSYVRIYWNLPLLTLSENIDYIYLHYFNDHNKCGSWCFFSNKLPVEETRTRTEEMMRKYWCTKKTGAC